MPTSITTRFGVPIPPLSPKETQTIRNVLAKMKPGVPITHDLSIQEEYDFVVRQHGGEEHLATYYPATLFMLRKAREHAHELKTQGKDPRKSHVTLLQMEDPPANTWQTANAIANIDYVDTTLSSFQASGASTVVEGTYLTQLAMNIYDETQGMQLIASEPIPNLYDGGEYVTVSAEGELLSPGDTGVAIMTASYMVTGESQMVSQSVQGSTPPICPLQPPTVTAPVHSAVPPNQTIKVALNRTPQEQSDCDYYYQTGMSGPEPLVGIAVSGSATYQNPICPLNYGTTLAGSLLLFKRTIPGGMSYLPLLASFPGGVTASGGTLAWSWGANNEFGACPWNQGDVIDLSLGIMVAVSQNCSQQTTTNAQINVLSSPNTDPGACTTKIDPLSFVWGCLASETMIRMADGTVKPVAAVRVGEEVMCAGGRLAEVADKIVGLEDREQSLRIRVGRTSIVVTKSHPMITPRGIVAARDLLIGQELLTDRGVDRIADIQAFWYRNRVVNLDLRPIGWQAEPNEQGIDGVVHLADGVWVGDATMQASMREVAERRRTDLQAILHSIPKEYEHDRVNLELARQGEPLIAV